MPHDRTESTAAHNEIFLPFAERARAEFTRVLVENGRLAANDPTLEIRVDRAMNRFANRFIGSPDEVSTVELTEERILSSSEGGVMDDPKPSVPL
jgi:hypothetical protein